MYYSQPKDVEELRIFCSFLDQERCENLTKAICYAAAYQRLYSVAIAAGGKLAEIATEVRNKLECEHDLVLQTVENVEENVEENDTSSDAQINQLRELLHRIWLNADIPNSDLEEEVRKNMIPAGERD